MTITEKARQRLDKAGEEIKDAVDSLREEVAELSRKVKEKLKGAGDDMKETAQELTQEVRELGEKVRDLIPQKRKNANVPVTVNRSRAMTPRDVWEQPFLEFQRAMQHLFDDFFSHPGWPTDLWHMPERISPDVFGTRWPNADLVETEEEIKVSAELPGVNKEDIEISLDGNRVTIRGEKKRYEESEGSGYFQAERSFGSFQRTFTLPCEVDEENVDASFRDGVLTVKFPKTAAARERVKKITVRSE